MSFVGMLTSDEITAITMPTPAAQHEVGVTAGLRRLLPDQLMRLNPGDVRYIRLYRAYHPTGLLIFEGNAELAVDRNERKTVLLSVSLQPSDTEWPEYLLYHGMKGQYPDTQADGTLVIEDWVMEVYATDGLGDIYRPRDSAHQDDFLRWDIISIRECNYLRIEWTQLHRRARYVNHRLTV